jgi:hypothetical protein
MTHIDSIDEVEKAVGTLLQRGTKPEEVCVVLDFHGVIVEQEEHTPPLSLKGNIWHTLEYLQTQGVPTIVATAWDDFNAVIQEGIIPLKLEGFFGVDPHHTAVFERFPAGVEGYRNGNVVALRDIGSEGYYRQKAFAAKVVFPDRFFKDVIFVDDSRGNLTIFQEDSQHMENPNCEEVILYHLQ